MKFYRFIILFFLTVGCITEIEIPSAIKPFNLSYELNQLTVKFGKGALSDAPTIEGDTSFFYSIEKIIEVISNVEINTGTDIIINSQSGIIELVSGNTLAIGDYALTINVSNDGGETTFIGAFTFKIREADIPKNLSYNPNNIYIEEGVNFTSVQPTIDGTSPHTFTLQNASSLGTFISVNNTNGVISIDGAISNIGEYILNIEVENSEGVSLFENIYTITIEQHTVAVSNGYYIAQSTIDPLSANILLTEKVEADNFSSQTRTGFYANYVYLDAGNYHLVKVENNHIITIYGGNSSTINLTADCGSKAYTLVAATENGATFAVTAGLYKTSYDETTGEIILFKIENTGIIGSSTSNGWGSDTPVLLQETISSDGATWETSDVVLLAGAFKVRLNCGWHIDRRIDKNSTFSSTNGYAMFTNFGGTSNTLTNGNDGSDIQVTAKGGIAPDEGICNTHRLGV